MLRETHKKLFEFISFALAHTSAGKSVVKRQKEERMNGEMAEKFYSFYGTERHTVLSTRVRHWFPTEPDESNPLIPTLF
jgi:hypothetical protein